MTGAAQVTLSRLLPGVPGVVSRWTRAAMHENRPVGDHRLAVAESASKYASQEGNGAGMSSRIWGQVFHGRPAGFVKSSRQELLEFM